MAKKKTPAKKTTKKAAKKAAAKKAPAKKAIAKKSAAKKATKKKAVAKKAVKKAPSKKAAAKKATKKTAVKKVAAKKSTKKASAKKSPVKKAASKKVSAKKATSKKATRKAASKSASRSRNKQSVKNIKRIDSTKTHGWQVHVRRGGVLKTKLFSDKVFKGKRKALDAAKVHRDELLEEMAKLAKPLWRIKRTPRTNTGKLGVSLTEYSNKSGKKRQVITVTAREKLGKAVNRKFSVDKLGYEKAVKKAVAWRNKVLRERGKEEVDG